MSTRVTTSPSSRHSALPSLRTAVHYLWPYALALVVASATYPFWAPWAPYVIGALVVGVFAVFIYKARRSLDQPELEEEDLVKPMHTLADQTFPRLEEVRKVRYSRYDEKVMVADGEKKYGDIAGQLFVDRLTLDAEWKSYITALGIEYPTLEDADAFYATFKEEEVGLRLSQNYHLLIDYLDASSTVISPR